MISAAINPISKEPIVRETRAPGRWRSLPRACCDLIRYHADTDGIWKPDYFDMVPVADGQVGVGETRCWKCGRALTKTFPLLRRVSGVQGKHNASPVLRPDGRPVMTRIPLECYREGDLQLTNGSLCTFLHCADCRITQADGLTLMAFNLGGQDEENARQPARYNSTPDQMAQYMSRFSKVEPVRILGPSRSPADLNVDYLKE